jgi:hypothetical protein
MLAAQNLVRLDRIGTHRKIDWPVQNFGSNLSMLQRTTLIPADLHGVIAARGLAKKRQLIREPFMFTEALATHSTSAKSCEQHRDATFRTNNRYRCRGVLIGT